MRSLRDAWEHHADEWVREPRQGDGGRWDRVPLFLDLRAVRP